MRRLCFALLTAAALSACGGQPQRSMDTDEIRRNADDANAELDRESAKNNEE